MQDEADRGFYRGLLTSCGPDHIGPPAERAAERFHCPNRRADAFPMHGRYNASPARLIGYGVRVRDGLLEAYVEGAVTQVAVFGEHLGKLGKSLGSSVDSFNKAVGSLEQQVLPAARRFPDLGLRMSRELEPIDPVANLARIPRGADAEPDPGDADAEPDSAGEAGSETT